MFQKLSAAGLMGLTLLAVCAVAAQARTTPSGGTRDFSGIWTVDEQGGQFANAPFGYDAVARTVVPHPPLTPDYQKAYDERLASLAAGRPPADSGASCLPNGMPRMMRDRPIYPIEILMTPKVVYTLHEYGGQTRRIYIDGRLHPDDVDPTYSGHSIGHWEGPVLVVDTVGVKAGWFDQGGLPHSDAIHVTERIRRIDDQAMEDRMTIDDPKAFIGSWTVTKRYKLRTDWTMGEFVCQENNRNRIGADGTVGVAVGK